MMNRRHCNRSDNSSCKLCLLNVLEDCDHLFFTCPFSVSCWGSLDIYWDMSMDIRDRVRAAKASFSGPSFIMIFLCAAWHIWKQRNSFIFDRSPPSLSSWFAGFKQELFLLSHRIKENHRSILLAWL
ncbi:hypothetical protein BRADI_2g51465v3 [Brachypodium distachyon]|uniref:Reverse transcriptase zinc-binding domain-containing protein n=1 Tax=Brachypodium distachyon TaxID=15368 RepID=A0A2K2DF99_BRADI|nr:hypothetical protein BRADI_2g51465v3 [Brachypodium distachyon]